VNLFQFRSNNFGSQILFLKTSTKHFLSLSILSLTFSMGAIANDDIDEIIIVGSNFSIEKSKLGSAITVIHSDMIEAIAAPYLSDVLRHVPGLAVSRTGAGGGLTSVRVRGSEANHVLVIIDGVEMNDANGGFDFSSLVTANIERIEILRGPQSGLYGSNATAGVINIVTKGANGTGVDVTVEAGSLDYRRATVNAYASSERLSGSLQVHHQESAFDASIYTNALEDDDKDENNSLSGSASIRITDNFSVNAKIRLLDKESDIDGSGGFGSPQQGLAIDTRGSATLEEQNYYLGAKLAFLDGDSETRLSYTYSDRDNQNLTDANLLDFGNDDAKSKLALSSLLVFPELGRYSHQGAIFIEREEEKFQQKRPQTPASLMFFDASQAVEKSRVLKGVGFEYRANFSERVFLSLTARKDNNDAFEDETTYGFTSAFRITDGTKLHGSVGTGVSNPSFFEQFGFVPATFAGNPDLLPEKSLAWDIGVEQAFFDNSVVIDLTLFKADLENEIRTVYAPITFAATPVNSQVDSDRSGLEFSFQGYFSDSLSVTAAYTYTNSQQNHQREVRRPQNTGSLDFQYSLLNNNGKINFGAVYNGTQLDSDFRSGSAGPVSLDSYVLVNLGGSYQFGSLLTVYSSINNLLDEEYQEILSYDTPGRNLTIGAKLSF